MLLWVCVVGFLLLAVWQLFEAAIGYGETSDRLKAAAKGVTYLFFAWTTFKVGQGASSSAEKQTEDFTAGLMGSPGGRLLVGVVGLVVLGIAGYHVYKGWTKKFLEDLREHPGDWAVTAGRIGYIAKGIALVIVGLLLPRRGLAGRPRQGAGPRRRAQDPQGRAVRARSCSPSWRRASPPTACTRSPARATRGSERSRRSTRPRASTSDDAVPDAGSRRR